MRLNYKLNQKIKYLAVIEFQERGAVHYHVLSDIPYIPQKELQDIWGHGFVYINAVKHVDNIGAYIVKYRFFFIFCLPLFSISSTSSENYIANSYILL